MAGIRIALVANPESGHHTDHPALEEELRLAGAEVASFGLEQLDEAASSGIDRLVVAGGDGMVGPAADAAGRAGVPLAVLPTGTANDFVRGAGIPLDVPSACRLAVTGQELRRLELGRMNGRPFINTASLGLSVHAAREAVSLKRKLRRFAYMFGALRAGVTQSPMRCRVVCDGEEFFAGKAWQAIVAASGRFGAGSSVAAADSGDGLLDIVVVPAGPRTRLVRYAYAMRRGHIASAGQACHRRSAHTHVEIGDDDYWNVDGELDCRGSAEFTAEPAAVRVVVG